MSWHEKKLLSLCKYVVEVIVQQVFLLITISYSNTKHITTKIQLLLARLQVWKNWSSQNKEKPNVWVTDHQEHLMSTRVTSSWTGIKLWRMAQFTKSL